jgi:enamine deaminase RidA (YjgF/YER057c/UK114 family)
VVKLTGFVASDPRFHEQPRVIDAASRLMAEVFGDAGRHARSAIGVAVLPRDASVELEMVVAVHDV